MRVQRWAGMAMVAVLAAACSGEGDIAAPRADLSSHSVGLVPMPSGPAVEEITVCKVGGEGTYDFTYSGTSVQGPVGGGFSLMPGQCWFVGYWGGTGGAISITETPRDGHEVVSISVDQLSGADQNVTGTNTVSGVMASGSPNQGALVVFTNRVIPTTGTEGCTPGYWKNHAGYGPQGNSWPPSGYAPADLFSSVFTGATTLSASLTLHDALGLPGGGGIAGAERNLARAAVAALLNASHPGVNYPLTAADVISQVNAALATQHRGTMLALAEQLDIRNNLGCPLN